jgi:formylglycine-generating enzyme required for sulfatase activity
MKDSTNPVKEKDKKDYKYANEASSFFPVYRGGCWYDYGDACDARVSLRNWFNPSLRLRFLGFRLVKNKGKS